MRKLIALLILLLCVVTPAQSSNDHQTANYLSQEDTSATDRYGFEMVYVPPGTFEMGEDEATIRDFYDKMGIEYTILSLGSPEILQTYEVEMYGFWIDKYEVTVAQYEERTTCIVYGECPSIAERAVDASLASDPQQPALGINWYDAMIFCNNRDARLPTEEEWEYAASGPENLLFPWGNDPIEENLHSETFPATHPVGSMPDNKSWIGAYDMAGNVFEWVEDRYFPAYNGTIQVEGENSKSFETMRVLRGGTYYSNLPDVTTYVRSPAEPRSSAQYFGFRCARITDPRNDK